MCGGQSGVFNFPPCGWRVNLIIRLWLRDEPDIALICSDLSAGLKIQEVWKSSLWRFNMGMLKIVALMSIVAMVTARPSNTADNDLRALLAELERMGLQQTVPLTDIQPAENTGLNKVSNKADPCDPKKCKLPNCRCSGFDIPGGLKKEEVPQMVVLTFQNAVNAINYNKYMSLIQGKKNPNGCPFSATFFVQHNYSDYWAVQSLYAARQEIGDNTVTFPSPTPDPKVADWQKQLQSQKTILSHWAGVAADDIQGVRAPNLAPGGNAQLQAMVNAKLSYDSSRVTTQFIDSPSILWPYTYDFASTQDCPVPPCPNASFPGVWEVPIQAWECNGARWSTPQSCDVKNAKDAFWLLYDKYDKHASSSNRAPLTIVLDSSWIVTDFKLQATLAFLHVLDQFHSDTYVVSAEHVLEWIRNPTPLANLKGFKPWKCDGPAPKVCDQTQSNNCQFDADRRLIPGGGSGALYYMRTCQTCPKCYPGLDDPLGQTC